MSDDPALDWALYRRLALGLLSWSPETFWAATPDDLHAALEGMRGHLHGSPAAAGRADLERLSRDFGGA